LAQPPSTRLPSRRLPIWRDFRRSQLDLHLVGKIDGKRIRKTLPVEWGRATVPHYDNKKPQHFVVLIRNQSYNPRDEKFDCPSSRKDPAGAKEPWFAPLAHNRNASRTPQEFFCLNQL
jgi:hypothetical protein